MSTKRWTQLHEREGLKKEEIYRRKWQTRNPLFAQLVVPRQTLRPIDPLCCNGCHLPRRSPGKITEKKKLKDTEGERSMNWTKGHKGEIDEPKPRGTKRRTEGEKRDQRTRGTKLKAFEVEVPEGDKARRAVPEGEKVRRPRREVAVACSSKF